MRPVCLSDARVGLRQHSVGKYKNIFFNTELRVSDYPDYEVSTAQMAARKVAPSHQEKTMAARQIGIIHGRTLGMGYFPLALFLKTTYLMRSKIFPKI